MKERIRSVLHKVDQLSLTTRYILGFICVIIGILGLVLPFLQGMLFLLISLVLFGVLEYEHLEKSQRVWNEYWSRKK